MKQKTLITLLMLCTALCTHAQITKGNWLVGGEGSLSYDKARLDNGGVEDGFEDSFLNLSPDVGYFFVDQFAAGLALNFGVSDLGKDNSNTRLELNPFLKYYFLKDAERVNIFTQIGYLQNLSKGGNDYSGFNISAGPSFFFNSSVALELGLNYRYQKTNFDTGNTTLNRFFLSLGFQIFLEKKS